MQPHSWAPKNPVDSQLPRLLGRLPAQSCGPSASSRPRAGAAEAWVRLLPALLGSSCGLLQLSLVPALALWPQNQQLWTL